VGIFEITGREFIVNMSSLKTQKIIASVVVAVAASLAGNFIIASAINDEVVVCANKSTGKLHYRQNKQCLGSEASLTLNSTGAAGAAGAAGAKGATGADGGYPSTVTVRDITTTYTLQALDAGILLLAKDGVTITLPTNSAVPIATGTRINVANRKGNLLINPASGVTVNSASVQVAFDTGNFQFGTLIKIAPDDWFFMSSPDEFP